MTSISVTRTSFSSENRSWLLSAHGTEPGANPSVTLDNDLFGDEAPSGSTVAQVTATGLFGPYDPAATDGRELAAGHLFGTLVTRLPGKTGGAIVKHGFVDAARLPAGDNFDAAAATQLRMIDYRNAPSA